MNRKAAINTFIYIIDYAFIALYIEIYNHTTGLKLVYRLKIHSQKIVILLEKKKNWGHNIVNPVKGNATIQLRRKCRKKKLEKSASKSLQHNNSINKKRN